MNQNFDFSNSKHSLDNKSKVIDNQGANIENQNFHIHLAMNKKAFTIFIFIITTFLIFYCYKSYQEYKDKKYKEERIRVLIEEKNSIIKQNFDKDKAKEDIKKILE